MELCLQPWTCSLDLGLELAALLTSFVIDCKKRFRNMIDFVSRRGTSSGTYNTELQLNLGSPFTMLRK